MEQIIQDAAPKSYLDSMLDNAGRTAEFIRGAEKLFSDINDELLMTHAGQFAIIKRQLDGSIALQTIVPTNAAAQLYVGADTYIKVIGQ